MPRLQRKRAGASSRLFPRRLRQPHRRDVGRAGRERVLALAEELDIAIIEDAAYQFAAYDGEAVPADPCARDRRKGDINSNPHDLCGSFLEDAGAWPCVRLDLRRRTGDSASCADEAGSHLQSSTINQMAIATVAGRASSAGGENHKAYRHGVTRCCRARKIHARRRHLTKPEGGCSSG